MWKRCLMALLALGVWQAQAGMGQDVLAATGDDGPVTIFYPTAASEQPVQRGPFTLPLAVQAEPRRGNGRLVVLSHGSGGGPWVHSDLARALVHAGYGVALPEHRGDNWRDMGDAGPVSWERRPAEVSRAIDAVARDPRFAPLLQLQRVGMFGQSAGGHTGLSLAGGAWSPARFRDHCLAHLQDDFNACVGLITQLSGGWLDGTKLRVARWVHTWKFDDERPHTHHDARIAAVAVGVPAAADFDPATLVQPRVPLGLILAGQDPWLAPRFHGERIKAACQGCELLAELPTAGHALMISPPPPLRALGAIAARLLADPPGYERDAATALLNQRITAFFNRHLPAPEPPH